jgi:hypothetical protein
VQDKMEVLNLSIGIKSQKKIENQKKGNKRKEDKEEEANKEIEVPRMDVE